MLSTLPATTNSRKVSGDEFNTFTYNDTENNTQTDWKEKEEKANKIIILLGYLWGKIMFLLS